MGSRYLVTGGAGFIGRYLCEALLQRGHQVRVLDALIEQVHGQISPQAAPVPKDVEFIHGDVRDAKAVAAALQDVDGVFHLAAEVGVGQSMYEIVRYTDTNDLGTAVLLQAMVEMPVKRMVVASSMSVYGEGLYETAAGTRVEQVRRDHGRVRLALWDPVTTEGAPLTPVPTPEDKRVDLASIYALNKYVQERSCLIFGSAYSVEVVALRLFNVFGPGQALSNPYTGVLANFASRLLHKQSPMIFEDGQQKRDFVHVRDVARAFCLAMETPAAKGEVINIGSGRSYTIADVAGLLARAMETNLPPEILGKARSGDIRHCFADISKAGSLLGYRPEFLLEETVGEVAEWVRRSEAIDRGLDARRELEARGLVA